MRRAQTLAMPRTRLGPPERGSSSWPRRHQKAALPHAAALKRLLWLHAARDVSCRVCHHKVHDLGSLPGKARERGWSGVGLPELEAAESYVNCRARPCSACRTSQAYLGAASCPTAFIVSGLRTRITVAFTEPTVALQTAFSNGPPNCRRAQAVWPPARLRPCTSTVYKAMVLTAVIWLMHV